MNTRSSRRTVNRLQRVRPLCEPLLRLLRSTHYRVAAQAGAYATGSLRGWPHAPSSRANRTCAAMVAFGTNGRTAFCAHSMHCRVQHVPLRLAGSLMRLHAGDFSAWPPAFLSEYSE